MIKHFAIIILFCSCSVIKPKPVVVETDRVPNVMSRNVPKEPVIPPRSIEEAMAYKKSVMDMALSMDTALHKADMKLLFQSKSIDSLLKWKVASRGIIDSLVDLSKRNKHELESVKTELDKFKYTYFRPEYFEVVNGVMDSVAPIISKPLPQPLGRTQSPVASPSWYYQHSIQYPINND